ncbi:MAG: sigma 54-interacting transcriptional regulator [Firmicutes bacterium]|nr:sigma 54-interacting transcriptional regulator [Bacillota bacterium]
MSLFAELFKERNLYFDLFDRLRDAVYIHDKETRCVYMNRAAENLEGVVFEEIKGKTVEEVYGLTGLESPLLRALGLETSVVNEKYTYYIKGKEITQLCNSGPIYENGCLIGAYTIQQDLTSINDMVEKNIALQQLLNRDKERMPIVSSDPFGNIIGNSERFAHTVSQARRAARSDSSVMLIGQTGCGKEVFARAVHEGSGRAKRPFIALNCAAIPETLIESILFGTVKGVYTGAVEKEGILAQADGGTVFLDEINSMPLASQAKLLRVLEERRIMKLGSNREVPIDIRVVSSTNEDPKDAVRNGHIREDLLYRLSVVPIVIPSLRERREDIPYLVDHFVAEYNERFHKCILGVDDDVMTCFMDFHWPGNVRQLKTCIESAMNFAEDGGYICMKDLPVYVFDDAIDTEIRHRRYRRMDEKGSFHFTSERDAERKGEDETKPFMKSVEDAERQELMTAIREAKGNLAKAARSLGISRQLMYYRVKKYNLK